SRSASRSFPARAARRRSRQSAPKPQPARIQRSIPLTTTRNQRIPVDDNGEARCSTVALIISPPTKGGPTAGFLGIGAGDGNRTHTPLSGPRILRRIQALFFGQILRLS